MANKNNKSLIFWPKLIMIMAGFWNKPVSKNRLFQILFVVYSGFIKVSCLICWSQLLAEFIRLIIGGYPAEVILSALSVLVNATKIATKVVIYVKNNVLDMFNDVIDKEREIWASSEEIKKVYTAQIRMSRFYIAVIAIGTFCTIYSIELIGAAATIQLKRYNEVHNETLEPHYMLLTIYPRDKLANLKMHFATQVLWSWMGSIFNCVTHIIFLTLLVYSVTRLEILQVRLRTYIEPDFSDDPTEEEVNEKILVLRSLIDEHKYIIGYIELLNERMKNIMMLEFVLSSLDIASVTANLIKQTDLSEILSLLVFLVLVVAQISIMGWLCNEVKVQSEAIGDALYHSRWYLLNKEGKQLTLIMLARAQKPLMITIGSFGPMTTNSVVLILKAAYSYVSIMKE